MRSVNLLAYSLLLVCSLGMPSVCHGQRYEDMLGGRIDGYRFFYDEDLRGASTQVTPVFPPDDVLKSVADSWVSGLKRYPPLQLFSSKDDWKLAAVQTSRAYGWKTMAWLEGTPRNPAFSGLPFSMGLLVGPDGIKWPKLSMYENAGPYGDDVYLEAEFRIHNGLMSTSLTKDEAIEIANEKLADLCKQPQPANLVELDDQLKSHNASMRLTAGHAEKMEIVTGLFVWSVLVKGETANASNDVLWSDDEALQIWVLSRTEASELRMKKRADLRFPW